MFTDFSKDSHCSICQANTFSDDFSVRSVFIATKSGSLVCYKCHSKKDSKISSEDENLIIEDRMGSKTLPKWIKLAHVVNHLSENLPQFK